MEAPAEALQGRLAKGSERGLHEVKVHFYFLLCCVVLPVTITSFKQMVMTMTMEMVITTNYVFVIITLSSHYCCWFHWSCCFAYYLLLSSLSPLLFCFKEKNDNYFLHKKTQETIF